MRAPTRFLMVSLASAGCIAPAGAQGPLRDVESLRDGFVSFRFASRGDVCGFGTSLLRVGGARPFDRGVVTWSSGDGWGPCERGPIRVLLTRAEGATVGIRVAVGEGPLPEGARDLGAVPAATAGAYLLDLARRLDGRVAREAMMAGVLSDSTDTPRGLVGIATDRTRAGSTRESATGWLGREAALAEGDDRREIVASLTALAKSADEPLALRRRAVSALGRAESEGVEVLLELGASRDAVLARAAVDALGETGDPRAREFLRRTVRDGATLEAVKVTAIKELSGRDAAPGDYALLRELYPTLDAGDTRAAVLEALAQAGGATNVRWLLETARAVDRSSEERRRALRAAGQAGATTGDLIRLYDEGQDRRLKESLVNELARLGDRAAVEKLQQIARNDTDPSVRRAAVNQLARTGDPEAVETLRELVKP